LINQHCVAKTSHVPKVLGKPTVVNEAMNLAAHTFALTEDGKRIYVLKGQNLIIELV
jgi:hypothetical protein